MFTQTCPDCNGKFSNEKEVVSKQMLSRHRAKVHGVVTPQMAYNRQWRKEHAAPAAQAKAAQLANLAKARAARWAHLKEPHVEPKREQLQASSWWRVEGSNKPITCPCCSAQFVIIKPS